ncbi:MAG: PEGA domain-containing protein [Polyangiaceae bacterium]
MSTRFARLLSGLSLGVFLLLSLAAPAQSGGPLPSQTLKAIRAQMERGQAQFLAKDYEGAAKTFEQGFSQHRYPAFLFNVGVCYERLGRLGQAADELERYLQADPDAADAASVRERIAKLRAAAQSAPAAEAGLDADGGGAAHIAEGGVAVLPPAPVETKSLIIIETEPAGAPIRLYRKVAPGVPKFQMGTQQAGWKEVLARPSPLSATLDEGDYHLVIEKFRDFNATDTDVRIEPGRVLHFRANLSQGKFMGFLRVAANVEGAQVFVDDPERKRPPWGRTPASELVSRGDHTLLVVKPGYEPLEKRVQVEQAQQVEVTVNLVREGFGTLTFDANTAEARVEIDGRPIGVWRSGAAPLSQRLPAGRRRVVIRADGHKTYEGTVEVPRGQVMAVHAEMIETPSRGAAWTQAIVGGVFLGAGIFLGLESNSLHEELEADRKAGALERDDERINRGRLFAIGADVGFVLGGVLGGLATYNFIKDPLPESGVRVDAPKEPKDEPPRAHARLPRPRPLVRVRRPAPVQWQFGLLGIGGRF